MFLTLLADPEADARAVEALGHDMQRVCERTKALYEALLATNSKSSKVGS